MLSPAYVPAISLRKAWPFVPKRDARHKFTLGGEAGRVAGHDRKLFFKLRHDFHVIGIAELIDRGHRCDLVAAGDENFCVAGKCRRIT